ncbi:MAG: NAD(P)-binding domain-containing protein, partial [Actinomycetota bacterium]
MAELEKPFPPGRYPVVVVGSGPGGLQTSYCLSRLGIDHAVISADEKPGGMFQKFPLFQRLISWSKLHAPAPHKSRAYEWYDWNSLLSEEDENRQLILDYMDGTSYFPSRMEMEQGLAAFADKAGVKVRYGCRWETTTRSPEGFTLHTTDGDYSCDVAVIAVGTTTPWKPDNIQGLDLAPHYVEARPAKEYEDKTVFIVGKRNSGMEIADALLPTARRIILGSPRPARLSVLEHGWVGARARYLQPYEDFVLGGGHVLLDVSIDGIERTSSGYKVTAMSPESGKMTFEVDE